MVPPPSGALTIPSIHVVDALAGLAITTPFGSGSVKAKSSTGEGIKLVMVKVSVETLPGPIVSGENVLVKPGPDRPALADHGRKIARTRNIKTSVFFVCFSVYIFDIIPPLVKYFDIPTTSIDQFFKK
jgi:hypothetical protein